MGAESAGMWRIGVMMGWEGGVADESGWLGGRREGRAGVAEGPFTGVTG